MSQWKELTQDSQARWDMNAEFWDDYIGEESNQFHRELIRPYTEKLLNIEGGETILDIACGNGNFSRRLAELGGNVVAVDHSPKMIQRAKQRSRKYLHQITYKVIDATNYESLMGLGNQQFDHAVANMALMDIADISPLITALRTLLKQNGTFVFSISHPCFQTPDVKKINETEEREGEIISKNSIQISKYVTPEPYEAIGIKNQPTPHIMFHRPLSSYINLFFQSGFVLDGIEEPSFTKKEETKTFDWFEIPPVVIMRFRNI